MASHLELEAEEQRESGLPPEEAHYAARRTFGNTASVKEDVRATWSLIWLEGFAQDAKYGARVLRKSPGFTVVAALTLTLGIGANTAIFSVVESVLLRPLPFSAPDQIVRVYSTKDGVPVEGSGWPSPTDMRDFAQSNHTFEKMAVYDTWRKNVSFTDSEAEPEQMRVGLVPGAYFQILDIQPIMGRLFTEDESWTGKNYVAAISAQLWKNRFGADKAVLGRKIIINDEPYTIVAVMPNAIPEWMQLADDGDYSAVHIWTPFGFADSLGDIWTEAGRGGRGGYYSLARIKPGVSLEQAQA
ncbi:MAG: ABC transporter permease, partial [Silvibacterium sp.]